MIVEGRTIRTLAELRAFCDAVARVTVAGDGVRFSTPVDMRIVRLRQGDEVVHDLVVRPWRCGV